MYSPDRVYVSACLHYITMYYNPAVHCHLLNNFERVCKVCAVSDQGSVAWPFLNSPGAREHKVFSLRGQLSSTLGSVTLIQSAWSTSNEFFRRCIYTKTADLDTLTVQYKQYSYNLNDSQISVTMYTHDSLYGTQCMTVLLDFSVWK